MRKTVIITLAALALVSCRQNTYSEEEIRANALGYLQAVGDYHFDEATPYCTRQTRENTLPTFNYLLEHADTAFVNANRPSVFSIHKVNKINDTTARVHYHKSTPIKEMDDSLTVLYEEGHWLADVRIKPLPFGNGKKLERRPLSEIPRGLTPHPASTLKPEMLAPQAKTPDSEVSKKSQASE